MKNLKIGMLMLVACIGMVSGCETPDGEDLMLDGDPLGTLQQELVGQPCQANSQCGPSEFCLSGFCVRNRAAIIDTPFGPMGEGDSGIGGVSVPTNPTSEVLRMVNQERMKKGLRALSRDFRLDSVAYNHCVNMCNRGIFDHVIDNKNVAGRLADAGIYFTASGENIHWHSDPASPANAVKAWMASPGHRDNILGAFSYVGTGVYRCSLNGRNYFTQVFTR